MRFDRMDIVRTSIYYRHRPRAAEPSAERTLVVAPLHLSGNASINGGISRSRIRYVPAYCADGGNWSLHGHCRGILGGRLNLGYRLLNPSCWTAKTPLALHFVMGFACGSVSLGNLQGQDASSNTPLISSDQAAPLNIESQWFQPVRSWRRLSMKVMRKIMCHPLNIDEGSSLNPS